MSKEKNLDIFISKLLDAANIKYSADGSDIKEISEALKTASKKGTGNVGFPEFVGISNDFILVIEDKADLEKQANYTNDDKTELATDVKSLTDYAENGALHYGKHIIENTNFKKVFAFGCSGSEKHHIIRPIFIDENDYQLLQPVENFENFSSENIEKYYREQVLGETPPEVLEAEELIKQSAILHEALRNYGQLGDKEKPLVVSAILLALSDRNFKVEDLNGDEIRTDGEKIYDAVEDYMRRVKVTPQTKKDKVLRQFNIIRDRTLLNEVDERLEKTPLKYFTEFIQTKILASITANVKEDILGNFYGEFMKYSGGDGKSLGVVLTPPHITELFCDLAELKPTDIVFDPCCGTAGFLISAMHRMENLATTEEQKKHIKSNQLHGVEIREDMFSIATTNMILRDDGKSQLIPGNFLAMDAEELRKKKYTVGFINPPYSQAKGTDTAHLAEIQFIEHLLNSLDDNAICIAIVPQSTMVGGKRKEDKQCKKRILEKHSLKGVITLNKETFYRVGTNPCIAVFEAHRPHKPKERVKFFNFEDDGYIINKHIGPVKTERAKERKVKLLDCWFDRDDAESKFMVKTTIKHTDKWLHSFYYFNDEIPKKVGFEKTIIDYLTFEFSMVIQGRGHLLSNKVEPQKEVGSTLTLDAKQWEEFEIGKLFKVHTGGDLIISRIQKGNIPIISHSKSNNGIAEWTKSIPKQKLFDCNKTISLADRGNFHAYVQKTNFYIGTRVKALEALFPTPNVHTLSFICHSINKQAVKFSYGNNATRGVEQLKILLPKNRSGEPDYEFMEAYMKQLEYKKLQDYLNYKKP